MESFDPVRVAQRLQDFEEVLEMIHEVDSEGALALIPRLRISSFELVECMGDDPISLAVIHVRDAAMQVLEGAVALDRWRHMLAMDRRIMREAIHWKKRVLTDHD